MRLIFGGYKEGSFAELELESEKTNMRELQQSLGNKFRLALRSPTRLLGRVILQCFQTPYKNLVNSKGGQN